MFTRFYALLRAFISVKQFSKFTRFYALLSQLSSLLRLQFTPFTVYSVSNLNSALHSFSVKLINRELNLFTRFYALLGLHSIFQNYIKL